MVSILWIRSVSPACYGTLKDLSGTSKRVNKEESGWRNLEQKLWVFFY